MHILLRGDNIENLVKVVDVSKIINNLVQIKYHCKAKVIMVAKANFYGLGNLARFVDDFVDGYAVATANEGGCLRKYTDKKIIVFNARKEDIPCIVDSGLETNFYKADYLEELNRIAEYKNKIINVHIPIDTGMNRLGVKSEKEFLLVKNLVKNLPRIKLSGVYTHLYSTDSTHIKCQLDIFDSFCSKYQCDNNVFLHAISSQEIGVVTTNKYYDYVRIGLGCYAKTIENTYDVIKIYGNILEIKNVNKGENVGYDNGYVAKKDATIAVVTGGYYDGVNRKFKGQYAVVNSSKVKIVARPCMDVFFVDVSGVKAEIGDRVYLIDSDLGLSLEKVASNLKMSMHELLVGFNGRTKVKYENISDLS